jgi:hypothetical protein
MSDVLTVITRVISEHHNIRGHVKLAGDTVSDIEAIFTLRKAYSGWTQSSTQALVEKLNQTQQAVSFLEEGLKNHFIFEETALTPFFGEILMKALRYEHQEIFRQIEKAKTMLASTKLEGLSQQELFSRKSEIQQMVNHLSQTVEEHASHEEIILRMVEKAVANNG